MDSSPSPSSNRGAALSDDDIKERLNGTCVYGLKDSLDNVVTEFYDENSLEAQVMMYFSKEDAEESLERVKNKNPVMYSDYKVTRLAVSYILKMMDDDSYFRFVPESKYTHNASRRIRWPCFDDKGVLDPDDNGVDIDVDPDDSDLPNVPVFKGDLHKTMAACAGFTPPLQLGDFEVADLMTVIGGMKDDSNTEWNDVMFIPLGISLPAESTDKPESRDKPESSDKPEKPKSSVKPPQRGEKKEAATERKKKEET